VHVCAKLPASLTRSIGPFISNYVILQDLKRNNIQVSIEKRNNKIYFAQGWTRLRDFYGLTAGGWVTILYISPLLFYIKWPCSLFHSSNNILPQTQRIVYASLIIIMIIIIFESIWFYLWLNFFLQVVAMIDHSHDWCIYAIPSNPCIARAGV
jgi:hypothetical protein